MGVRFTIGSDREEVFSRMPKKTAAETADATINAREREKKRMSFRLRGGGVVGMAASG